MLLQCPLLLLLLQDVTGDLPFIMLLIPCRLSGVAKVTVHLPCGRLT
jgi:hypothetical protein